MKKSCRHSISHKAVTVKTMNETYKQKYNIKTQIYPIQQHLAPKQYKIIFTYLIISKNSEIV